MWVRPSIDFRSIAAPSPARCGLFRRSGATVCAPQHNEQNLNAAPSPYTVAVYPIEQEPGVWFATYLISEYKDGMERVLANVALREDTHRTAAKAKQAARRAGEGAVAHLAARQYARTHAHSHPFGANDHANKGARHG